MRPLKTYWSILRNKGLLYSLHEGWKAVFPFHITHEKEEWDLIFANNTFRHFERKYKRYIHDYPETTAPIPKKIWVLWLQGFENAPAIVRKCQQSIERYASDYEIHYLTRENMLDYVHLPQSILRSFQSGRLPFTQFSDILRAALLREQGGIWMDATVLLTDRFPDYVTNGSLFMLKSAWGNCGKIRASSNFLAACPHNPVFENQYRLLVEYWEHEWFLRDYMMFHLLFALIINTNAQAKRLFDAIPYIQNIDYHTMLFRMFEPYSDKLWNEITSRSTMHKLTYKFTEQQLLETEGSIYQHILNL